jgi:hypothetical protein
MSTLLREVKSRGAERTPSNKQYLTIGVENNKKIVVQIAVG